MLITIANRLFHSPFTKGGGSSPIARTVEQSSSVITRVYKSGRPCFKNVCKFCLMESIDFTTEVDISDNLEEAILNTLLGDCQITEGSSSILLAVPGNNTLMISIKMEPQGQYTIKLQSSSLAVVQEAHQAIKSRLVLVNLIACPYS